MMTSPRRRSPAWPLMQRPVALLLAVLLSPGALPAAAGEVGTAVLRDYVQRPDPTTAWWIRSGGEYRGAAYRELILTSQTWQDIPWRHQLYLIRPPRAVPGRPALLLIAGGRWQAAFGQVPAEPRLPSQAGLYVGIARRIGAPVAVLRQVPHQPLFDGLREDSLIAFTFEQFLRTGETDWPLLLPMTKAATAAMDAAQATLAAEWDLAVDQFVVTGASKRGWTTWLSAVADPRVVALAPMVIDMLDIERHLDHQRQTWGGFSPQIGDYVARGLPDRLASPAGQALLDIVDPWRHRAAIRQPKLVILSTNDPYWPVDSLGLYLPDLLGPTHIVYMPNSPHSPRDLSRLIDGVSALHRSVAGGPSLPDLKWAHGVEDGVPTLRIRAGDSPVAVRAWYATAAGRDFRQAGWQARPMRREPDGSYRFRLPVADGAIVGLFGEAEYGRGNGRFRLSTGLRLIGPDGVLSLAAGPGRPDQGAAGLSRLPAGGAGPAAYGSW